MVTSLREEVTIVVVTSFTAACPSTALIEATLSSFAFVPELETCRCIVVADGFVASHRRRTKAGRITAEDAALYVAYIDALRRLVGAAAIPDNEAHAETGASADNAQQRALPRILQNTVVLALETHHGFGWAVKAALESGHVETRQVLVVQHDRCFMRPFDLARAVDCMRADDRVRYLLVPTRSTRNHAETIAGRCKAKLPRIAVNGTQLQQLAFWWDSTHLATRDHYLNFVLAQFCVKRGTFPEDTLGKQMLADVKMNGVGAANKYHAYVWDDFEDRSLEAYGVVGHLNGAHWRAWTDETEKTDEHGAPLHNDRQRHFQRSLAAWRAGADGAAQPDVQMPKEHVPVDEAAEGAAEETAEGEGPFTAEGDGPFTAEGDGAFTAEGDGAFTAEDRRGAVYAPTGAEGSSCHVRTSLHACERLDGQVGHVHMRGRVHVHGECLC